MLKLSFSLIYVVLFILGIPFISRKQAKFENHHSVKLDVLIKLELWVKSLNSKNNNTRNNPFMIAIPRKEGHVVLDMAMSLYSCEKLEVTRQKGQKLPFPGGFDQDGH
jgi:hypothetical protein